MASVCDTMAEDEDETKFETFASFSYLLSPLILRALADLGFSRPTLVQQKAIPLALENRDVLARARTGSGKTAAYSIPLVQKILNAKAVGTLRGDRLVPIFPHNPPLFFIGPRPRGRFAPEHESVGFGANSRACRTSSRSLERAGKVL